MAYLDPLSRDFVLTSSNDLKGVDNPTLQGVVLRLMTERGSCFWDPDFGSTLHLVAREKGGPSTERDVADRARRALKPMVDDEDITDLTVQATRVDRGRVELAVRCLDAGRRPVAFSTFVAV